MFNKKTSSIFIFLLTVALVIIVQAIILKPIIKYQLIEPNDDWYWMLYYKSIEYMPFPLRFLTIWKFAGIHDTGYALYVGILGKILGSNYALYNLVTISFKVLATASLYPVIYLFFKNRKLAVITTSLYAITASSTGSFYWVMKGSVYVGILLMNLFLIAYHYTLTKKTTGWLMVSAFFIFLAYVFSTVRIFPFFFIVFGIEIYLLFKNKKRKYIKTTFLRISAYILPFLLVAFFAPVSPKGFVTTRPFTLLKEIINGNWHDLLSPVSGLGYSFFTNEYLPILGNISFQTFTSLKSFMVFLIRKPFPIYIIFSAILSFTVAKKKLYFFTRSIFMGFLFSLLLYKLTTHHFSVAQKLWNYYDEGFFYQLKSLAIFGTFSISLAITCFGEWLRNRNNKILFALWTGPVFAFVFLFAMWVTIGYLLNAYSSTGYYYVVPAIGMCLFVSSFFTSILEKHDRTILKIPLYILLMVIIYGYFITSKNEINRDFPSSKPINVSITNQELLHKKLISRLSQDKMTDNMLVYLEFPEEKNTEDYYQIAFLGFNYTIFFNDVTEGCVSFITNQEILLSSYDANRKIFELPATCFNKKRSEKNFYFKSISPQLYSPNDLYAYNVDSDNITDVKNKIISLNRSNNKND